jgi:hypothetical protein
MQIVWLRFSLKYMKRSLYYRYLKCKKLMIVASIMSIVYFTLLITPTSSRIGLYYNIHMNIIRHAYRDFTHSGFQYTPTSFIIFIVTDLLLNIDLPIYVLFNIRYIEFKVYLSDILIGRKLEKE